jgi:hypothetical protein
MLLVAVGCGGEAGAPDDDAGTVALHDAGDALDAGDPQPDAGDSTGLVPPNQSACCTSCAAGSSCQANGCYGGYFCDASRCRCVPPPTDGGSPACTHRCSAVGATSCASGKLRTCKADADGCRYWSSEAACPGGFCADALSCGTCQHECPTAGATRCEGGLVSRCEADSNGCRDWGEATACLSGFCADAQGCGSCEDECATAGATSCSAGSLRTCEADGNGCRAWSGPAACASGFCSGSACGVCNHGCAAEGLVECDGGKVRTCVADANGCRSWTTPSACASGFCADAERCGECNPACGAGCLWDQDFCMEVVREETATIGELSATSEGLFWNRDPGSSTSALVSLPFGQEAVQSLGSVQGAWMDLRSEDDVLYAKGWSQAAGARFFIKAPGQALLTPATSQGLSLLYAGTGTAFFAEGVSIYTPFRHIYRHVLPTGCPTSCSLGTGTLYYQGDEEWPGSDLGDSDGVRLYFVSVQYGNYPINDIKRGKSRILSAPLGGGEATLVREFYDKEGPLALTVVSGGLYYLLDGTIARIDLATGTEQRLYQAPGYTVPYRFVTDGRDLFWVDSASQLVRLRQGASAPEVLARNVDIGLPYNLALTDEAVYVTGEGRRTLLRWTRP